jgi:hypothetical protein
VGKCGQLERSRNGKMIGRSMHTAKEGWWDISVLSYEVWKDRSEMKISIVVMRDMKGWVYETVLERVREIARVNEVSR